MTELSLNRHTSASIDLKLASILPIFEQKKANKAVQFQASVEPNTRPVRSAQQRQHHESQQKYLAAAAAAGKAKPGAVPASLRKKRSSAAAATDQEQLLTGVHVI